MLAAPIQERHDNGNALCLSICGGNNPLQVFIMVVRRHMILFSEDGIGDTGIQHVNDDKQIYSADRIQDDSPSLTGP